jgi:hypothetical protein
MVTKLLTVDFRRIASFNVVLPQFAWIVTE